MNCFRHIDEPAAGTGEIYIGRDSNGEIYGIKPLCKPCFEKVVTQAEQKKKEDNTKSKHSLILFCCIAMIVFFFLSGLK